MPEIAENFIHLAQYITKSGHDLVLLFQKFYDNLRLLLLHKREHVLEILHLFLLLFHSLPHFSFVFSVSRQGSLKLCISFPLLWHYRLSFCYFALFLQPQLLFLPSPVSIPLAFSSSRIFALNLPLKSVYRSLTDRFVTLN